MERSGFAVDLESRSQYDASTSVSFTAFDRESADLRLVRRSLMVSREGSNSVGALLIASGSHIRSVALNAGELASAGRLSLAKALS